MTLLNNNELLNISGGAITSLPNFDNYIKLFKWIFKKVSSWF